MARQGATLTQYGVDRLTAENGKDKIVWDSTLPGFGVRARVAGSKVYVVKFRNASGQQRWLTLGDCASIPLSDRKNDQGRVIETGARTMARQALAAAAAGVDPATARDRLKAVPTVKEAAKDWLVYGETRAIKPWKAKTAYEYRRIVTGGIEPEWGHLRLDELTLKRLHTYQKKKSATPYEANRVLGALRSIIRHAIAHKTYSGEDPTTALGFYEEEERVCALEPEQIEELKKALRAHENQFPAAVLAIRLLLLTGARREEIVQARWEWVDWDAGVIRLPDDKSRRTGDKTRLKTVVLGDVGLFLLTPHRQAKGPIFPARTKDGTAYDGLGKAWSVIRKGLVGTNGRPLRLHDLRHAYGAAAIDAGIPDAQISEVLGHRDRRSTRRYTDARESTKRRVGSALAAALGQALGLTAPQLRDAIEQRPVSSSCDESQ